MKTKADSMGKKWLEKLGEEKEPVIKRRREYTDLGEEQVTCHASA